MSIEAQYMELRKEFVTIRQTLEELKKNQKLEIEHLQKITKEARHKLKQLREYSTEEIKKSNYSEKDKIRIIRSINSIAPYGV